MPHDVIMRYADYHDDFHKIEPVKRGESYEAYLARLMFIHMGQPPPEKTAPDNTSPFPPRVEALVDGGRWMWECVACSSGIVVDQPAGENTSQSYCPACNYAGWVDVILPDNWQAIEKELLKQPGFRTNTAFRQWETHWSLGYLRDRTAEAERQKASGVLRPRKASIGATRLWSVGEVLTASNKNTFERQVMRDLKGTNGPIGPYESAIVLWNATTTERNALTAEPGMMLYNETTDGIDFRDSSAWHRNPRVYRTPENNLFTGANSSYVEISDNHGLPSIPFNPRLRYRVVNATHGWDAGDIIYGPVHRSGRDDDNFGGSLVATIRYFRATSSAIRVRIERWNTGGGSGQFAEFRERTGNFSSVTSGDVVYSIECDYL